MKDYKTLENITRHSTTKGFIYQSSDIYGGYAAIYDFGQVGILLKKNIEKVWREWNVTQRTDIEEIEGSIFLHPKVWEASGHIGGFSDVLVEDMLTHKRYRADHVVEEAGIMENAGYLSPEELDKVILDNNILSIDGNKFSKSKNFNLMVKTHLGPTVDDSSVAYLKGESCQNIYVNWKQIRETSRRSLPFGVAQIGKAFRNEISARQFLFRTREFEQLDVQFFVKPSEADKWYEYWKENQLDFLIECIGLSKTNLRYRQHDKDEMAFYARDAWDIEYNFGDMGYKEIEGLHNRGSYDLDQHSKHSGKDLSYFDEETKERYNPYIVECSAGFNRFILAALFEAFTIEELENDSRTVMKFNYNIAPYKISVLPLMKKDGMEEFAFTLYEKLRKNNISASFDKAGSIGKRYRRADELGTPWCLTVDQDSLKDNTVTLRHRDTMKQVGENSRINIDDINEYLCSEKFTELSKTD